LNKFRFLTPLLLIIFVLAACGGGEPERLSTEDIRATAAVLAETQIAQTAAAVPPTQPPSPATDTPAAAEPTEAPPLAENVIFRDDFTTELDPGWFWESELPDRWTITPDGWLQITAADAGLVNAYRQDNLLFRDIPAGDFSISTFVRANPLHNFQQASIFIYLDNQNYVSVNRAICTISLCNAIGNGIFMEYQIGGIYYFFSAPLTETEVYLKLSVENNQIIGYYATTPGDWIQINFINYFAAFTKVGLSASNVDSANQVNDLVAQFDYFEITQP